MMTKTAELTAEMRTAAYRIAEECLAENLEVDDAIAAFFAARPAFAAACPDDLFRDAVYDILTEFSLDD